ncbi:MAG: glycosyl hydrolase [Cytophagaceae bacterium]|nr:glycosyl hydrolase [Cytophagaceae bacterium]MDW8457393.1 glycosyl hydrolase [Cytophagaceae bacterium]
MKKYILFFCIVVCFQLDFSKAQVSPKRGMAYGYHSVNDLNTVRSGISWWYNWTDVPDAGIASYYQSMGVEYVPMVWGGTFNTATVINNIRADAKYLLAFNEPNFNVEANLTPAQAVALWPQIEAIANARNLEIVSASAAYCGGSVCVPGYTNPVTWHNEFFALCPTCRVDHIAFHVYEPTVGGTTALVNNMKVFGRPIWVTEFAWWDPTTPMATKIPYLQQVVNAFENDPDVYRYSWFTGRSSNGSINLLGSDGVLTPLGAAYIGATYPVHNIPGIVQAENNYRRRGTGTQPTADVGGGLNVGWTDQGTWNEYLVNSNTSGSYTLNFRVASAVSTGRFDILVDGVVVRTNIATPNTGGWQNWTNLPVTGIVLTAGQHLIRLRYSGTGTNLNYINIVYETGLPPDANFVATPLNTCIGNHIVFTNTSTNLAGSETYTWNFGAGATPATATGPGPHIVSYSTSGQKTVSLTVTNMVGPDTETKINYINIAPPPSGCIFSDQFNNNTVNWITPIPGAFTHNETASEWIITNTGYGEWESFSYTLNNGTMATPISFACAAHKPLLHIRARASSNALLRLSMADGTGRAIDNIPAYNLELTTTYQTFTIDFTGRFRNHFGPSVGPVDSANIRSLVFFINPGYYSFPHTGSNGTYNTYFNGTVFIDWIGIGAGCSAPLYADITTFSYSRNGEHCRLHWSTAREYNMNYFDVEKSFDGVNFHFIGKVLAGGSHSSYLFDDPEVHNRACYYRLKIVQTDDRYSYSEVLSVSSVITSPHNAIQVYPNPGHASSVYIEGIAPQAYSAIEIYNISGEKIYEKKGEGGLIKIEPTELKDKLSRGMYVVREISSGMTKKLIID